MMESFSKWSHNVTTRAIHAFRLFLFQPSTSHTLSLIRIATGLMLAYIHAIWLYDVESFFGQTGWLNRESLTRIHGEQYKWSYLYYLDREIHLQIHQYIAITVSVMMALGLFTRLMVPLAWFVTLMVCHAATPFIFGLDQIVMFLCMYLIPACSGSVWSVDAWLRDRRGPYATGNDFILRDWFWPDDRAYSHNTFATRLIQIHLCVIYLFGGISKLRGEMWWEGTALWFAAASYEYQAVNLTWIGRSPALVSFLTHVTLVWETFYIALIWNRVTRPVMLAVAVAVHAGIGIFLGMITFGTIMIVANFAFVPAEVTRRIFRAGPRWPSQDSSNIEPQNAPDHQ